MNVSLSWKRLKDRFHLWRLQRMDRRIQRQVDILYTSLTETIRKELDIRLMIQAIDHRARQSSETIREINALCQLPEISEAMERIDRIVDYIGKDNHEAREQLTPVLMFGCRSYREYLQAVDRMLYKRYLDSCELIDAEDVEECLGEYFRTHPEDRPPYWHVLQNCRRMLGDLHTRVVQYDRTEEKPTHHDLMEPEGCPPLSGHPGRSA